MSIETTGPGLWLLIAIMAVVTLLTRYGGVFAMSFVRISPRIESFINTMASSVLIAIIVPMAVSGDLGALAALLVTARRHVAAAQAPAGHHPGVGGGRRGAVWGGRLGAAAFGHRVGVEQRQLGRYPAA